MIQGIKAARKVARMLLRRCHGNEFNFLLHGGHAWNGQAWVYERDLSARYECSAWTEAVALVNTKDFGLENAIKIA